MSETINKQKTIERFTESTKNINEKPLIKSFQSEGTSTLQNSLDSRINLSLNNINSIHLNKDKNSNKEVKNNKSKDSDNLKVYQKENLKDYFYKNDSKNKEDIDEKFDMKNIDKLFLQRKRLMKNSEILLQKKIIRKIAKRYLDKEAELGSDNEEHDDIVKKVYNSDSDEDKEEDKLADVEGLIDNNIKEDYLQNKKYFDDMLEKDHEEVLKVIEGPKKRIVKEAPTQIILDDNTLSLKIRMERMSDINYMKEEDELNNEENKFKSLEAKLKELKKQYKEDEMNDEIKEMIENNNHKIIKEINKITGQQNKDFKEHLNENKEILKNVIIRNNNKGDTNNSNTENDNNGNEIIIKGNGAGSLNNKKFKPFGFKKLLNNKNSLLNHIQKEKINNKYNTKSKISFHNNCNF